MPVMRRWHVVNNLGKTLSPAAEAFRYFILERGEGFLATHFPHDVAPSAPAADAAADQEGRPARSRQRRTAAGSAGVADAARGARRRT